MSTRGVKHTPGVVHESKCEKEKCEGSRGGSQDGEEKSIAYLFIVFIYFSDFPLCHWGDSLTATSTTSRSDRRDQEVT